MRVQCDVCGRDPAAVLCCADEAALCAACDRRVHRANKLAGKHRRVALLHPTTADANDGSDKNGSFAAPLCDVCKERRGLVFCVEDRAILCADCDEPIHDANELTARHSRFLLVGAKLSAALASSDDSDEPDDSACGEDAAKSGVLDANNGGGGGSHGSSSISEYLTKVCPGWRVEDLLVDDAATAAFAAATKGRDDEVPFLDSDLFDVVAARPEQSTWVPHVPQTPAAWAGLGAATATLAAPTAKPKHGHSHGRERWSDSDAFTVPQISPPAKRARPSSFWCY